MVNINIKHDQKPELTTGLKFVKVINDNGGDRNLAPAALAKELGVGNENPSPKIDNPGAAGVWDFSSGFNINYPELVADTVIMSIVGLPIMGITMATVTIDNPNGYYLTIDPSVIGVLDFDSANFDGTKLFSTALILVNEGNINIIYSPNTGIGTGGVQPPSGLIAISDPSDLTAVQL